MGAVRMTPSPDPVRTAAEQLEDAIEENFGEAEGLFTDAARLRMKQRRVEWIEAFARQQRKAAEQEVDDALSVTEASVRRLNATVEAAEARIAVLEGELAALRAERGAEGPRCRLCGDTESKHTKSPADWRTVPGCSKFTPPAASSGESEGGTR